MAFDACTVFGVVLDRATGQPLPGVEVFLINVDKNTSSRTLTNDKGEYVFDLVYPPGIYRIIATLKGYSTAEFKRLSVTINDTVVPVPPIALEPAATSTTGPWVCRTGSPDRSARAWGEEHRSVLRYRGDAPDARESGAHALVVRRGAGWAG